MTNVDAQRRKQNKTPVTNLFKHPGYRPERTIFIKTDTIYVFTWFPCAVYKTWFSRDYTLLPGAYSRETTVFPDLTLRLSLRLRHTLDCLVMNVPAWETGKLHISVYNVLRIDIFLKLKHRFASEVLYLHPGAVWCSFVMVGYFFSDSETGSPFTAILQIGTDRTMSNITLNVFVWKRNVRHA